jgi:hypothetical protein
MLLDRSDPSPLGFHLDGRALAYLGPSSSECQVIEAVQSGEVSRGGSDRFQAAPVRVKKDTPCAQFCPVD